jgi:heme/copper-type cytochrome/quinol oxidase subunit 2
MPNTIQDTLIRIVVLLMIVLFCTFFWFIVKYRAEITCIDKGGYPVRGECVQVIHG